ncbi:MAG: histidine--tRNA ligase [bacterium]
MAGQFKIIKGFQDVLPPKSEAWQELEEEAGSLFSLYGFRPVRLPLLEYTSLFARSIGEDTDIVEKEMFTFPDRKGRSLSLRPEGTASVVRAYLNAGLGKGEAVRWYYTGPMFRYERPQKGRYRQFYQVGAEAIGYPGPGTDAEILVMLDRLFQRLEVHKTICLHINSLGCRKCRPDYRKALVDYLESRKNELCPDCLRRMETNPLRVLDCKVEGCRKAIEGAPAPIDHLCDDCRDHLQGVENDLQAAGVSYEVNPRIVRGLDYYTRTVFEHLAEDGLGSQNAVCAGGRYDDLVEEFGGPPTPAIGFALGVERVAMLMKESDEPRPEFFIVSWGDKARRAAVELLYNLRDRGVRAGMLTDGADRSVKSQMKAASREGAKVVIILGEEEVEKSLYTVKNLETGEQKSIEGPFIKDDNAEPSKSLKKILDPWRVTE